MSTTAPPASNGPTLNDKILFWASFFTLIAAGIGFSVRGVEILKDWGNQFGFTQTELGTITGGGLVGFGLAIIFFSFLADRFGYGKLMVVAFLLHTLSAVVTFAATPVFNQYGKEGAFYCLNLGMWLFALGNGTCEAVINPLTATLFPKNKTHWLNILHAGWPGGLILGAVIMLGFNQFAPNIRWEYKLGVFLIPVFIYGVMMVGRRFPSSEAKSAGVSVSDMMKTIGLFGFTFAAVMIALALASFLPSVVGPAISTDDPEKRDVILSYLGGGIAFVIWLIFAWYTNFSIGSWVLALLYIMHALVGYVELGTDSWITNITNQVVQDQTQATLAFIWTNILMFTLRFFAGPIVHKINPVGLLFFSAVLGVIGLYLLGNPAINSIWPWLLAVTIYGIGKTFYWPTLLGVISERFPKGGALALGLSGGIGMISAGILGGPGIGYKQDYFAVSYLQETPERQQTYERYKARTDSGQPDLKGFPILSSFFPHVAPKVAGIDNARLKVFQDYADILDENGKPRPQQKTTLESDLETIETLKRQGRPVEPKLEENLRKLHQWWVQEGLPHFPEDRHILPQARLYGAKMALLYTAVVPATLAVGFLILILYFWLLGGYKQVHLEHGGAEHETRDY
ncbi:MAG: MFS transporter [Thermogemmata sp.]|nr:MFS transporter [Gemmataceae bacterium]